MLARSPRLVVFGIGGLGHHTVLGRDATCGGCTKGEVNVGWGEGSPVAAIKTLACPCTSFLPETLYSSLSGNPKPSNRHSRSLKAGAGGGAEHRIGGRCEQRVPCKLRISTAPLAML